MRVLLFNRIHSWSSPFQNGSCNCTTEGLSTKCIWPDGRRVASQQHYDLGIVSKSSLNVRSLARLDLGKSKNMGLSHVW